MIWFDAHLDLACLAVHGRDMTAPPERATKPWPPAAVTLPSLNTGGVAFALATIFIEQVNADTPASSLGPEQYRAGDIDGAARRGRAQLEVYETWRDRGLIKLDLPRCLKTDSGVGEIRGGMGVSEVVPTPIAARALRLAENGPHFGILVEGADSIRSPDDLEWWKSRGVCAVGLAWAKSSRYAQGNMGEVITGCTEREGLSALGREMIRAIDAHRLVHDLSHLSDRACDEMLTLTDRPVMASHSNGRELLGGDLNGKNQRHLRDGTIFEIARRGGVIGLNLFEKFLRPAPAHAAQPALAATNAGGQPTPARPSHPPTIDHALDHVEHVCAVAGHKRAVGLGSDMDGGFSAAQMCDGIERPEHLSRLAAGLRARNWSEDEIDGFTHLNWLRFWERQGAF
ncbi:MAG: dipeptidase [Phycisphaerales bacterium]